MNSYRTTKFFSYDYIYLMWLYVLLKLIDIISTIIGVEYFNLVELNFFGYFNVILISILSIIGMIHFIRLFYLDKTYNIRQNSYKVSKFILILLLFLLFCVSINNISCIIISIIVN